VKLRTPLRKKRKKMFELPRAGVSEVLGLIEAISAYGGKMRTAELLDEFPMDIDEFGEAIDMAELLGLVKVNKGYLTLTKKGEIIGAGSVEDKKRIIGEQLKNVEPFKSALQLLNERGEVSMRELIRHLKTIGYDLDEESYELFMNWGGYAELFEYDAEEGVIKVV